MLPVKLSTLSVQLQVFARTNALSCTDGKGLKLIIAIALMCRYALPEPAETMCISGMHAPRVVDHQNAASINVIRSRYFNSKDSLAVNCMESYHQQTLLQVVSLASSASSVSMHPRRLEQHLSLLHRHILEEGTE